MKRCFFCYVLLLFPFLGNLHAQSDHILWYDRPGEYFEETLVLGNGTMGASVFGGAAKEKIFLNDASLWSGEPVNPYMNPDAYKIIPQIREALKNEDYKKAGSLYRKVQGSFSQAYMPMGTLYITFDHKDPVTDYYRELDISKAVSKITYKSGNTTYSREYFISHPDKVMLIKLKSGTENALNFSINFDSPLKFETSNAAQTFRIYGYAPYHVEPPYRKGIKNPVRFDKKRGTRFTGLVKITETDGKVVYTNDSVTLKGGTEATIWVSVATSFNGFDKDPAKEGRDHLKTATEQLEKALEKPYGTVKKMHISDYQQFYNRLNLDLGDSQVGKIPTDKRLRLYAEGRDDKNLEELYFNFGRYLLISSSRTPAVPANLQGIWNPYIRPPWSSNYTININLEENYWPSEITNLSEMHVPLLGFIENLSKTGKITAKTFFGIGGWTANHNSDIWAMSNPVGDFGQGKPKWANWPMGGAWLSTHLWEHYTFTQDKDFLTTHGYPLMKDASEFCLEWLVEDKDGYLITSPSTSPENTFITSDGYKGGTFYGGSADIAIIKELFIQTVKASEVLQTDVEFRKKLKEALKRLRPYQIGKAGNLQEWYYDWKDLAPRHRHQSHLFGLYPGHHISVDKTPELAQACKKTLEIKGDNTTGWSMGWRINLWARLHDGNHAYKLYRNLLKYVEPDKKPGKRIKRGGTYPNLLDAHPPFQIDGNFGGTAAVIEMLVQSSDEGEIYILPALPDAWKEGHLKGVRARGGYELNFKWQDGKLQNLRITSITGGKVKIKSGQKEKYIELKKGETQTINW